MVDTDPKSWGNKFKRSKSSHIQVVLGQKKDREFDVLRKGEYFDPDEQYQVYIPLKKPIDSMEYAHMMSKSGSIRYGELCTKQRLFVIQVGACHVMLLY